MASIRWEQEAEALLRRVPFFVRHRVRKQVEEEVAAAGRTLVTRADLEASKKRHLQKLSQATTGYTLETCFGASGCANRVADANGLAADLERLLQEADLLAFLRSRLGDRLKLHHQFRLTLADCPNCCSQPQIKDIGITGQATLVCSPERCSGCGECAAACDEDALVFDGDLLRRVNEERCVRCGACARVCPPEAITLGEPGYRLLVGGKLGRHPQLARELAGGLGAEQVLVLVERIISFYKRHAEDGSRLGEVINQVGWDCFAREVMAAES